MSIIKRVKQNQELEKIETATLDSGWDIFLYLRCRLVLRMGVTSLSSITAKQGLNSQKTQRNNATGAMKRLFYSFIKYSPKDIQFIIAIITICYRPEEKT